MPEEQALLALDACLDREEAVLAPVALDAEALAAADPGVPAVLAELARYGGPDGVAGPRGPGRGGPADTDAGRWARRVAELPAQARLEEVEGLVGREVAAVLGLAAERPGTAAQTAVTREEDLWSLGMDSLTSLELSNRLASATGLRLPAALVLELPTVADLTAAILDQLGARTTGSH
jgi:acyl carrier protein